MKSYLSLIKFAHTVFALPFAVLAFFLGLKLEQVPFSWTFMGLILLCMIFARSAAMAFNRYIDRGIDAKNARTVLREIPAGIITPSSAIAFVVLFATFNHYLEVNWPQRPCATYCTLPLTLMTRSSPVCDPSM